MTMNKLEMSQKQVREAHSARVSRFLNVFQTINYDFIIKFKKNSVTS